MMSVACPTCQRKVEGERETFASTARLCIYCSRRTEVAVVSFLTWLNIAAVLPDVFYGGSATTRGVAGLEGKFERL